MIQTSTPVTTHRTTPTHHLTALDKAVDRALAQLEAARDDPEQEHIWREILAGLNVGIAAVLRDEERPQ